jgi:phosphoribosylformylglycinamidine synthase PurS subunit
MRARVLIRPKAGILDPQGIAVERALPALGFSGVSNVHVGRLIELDVEDPASLDAMCRRLLANPLIEDYEILDGRSASPAPATRSTRSSPPPGSATRCCSGTATATSRASTR